eukprot:scaffold441_cov382-Prasinococcus_capsulatus_cf.AAC.2
MAAASDAPSGGKLKEEEVRPADSDRRPVKDADASSKPEATASDKQETRPEEADGEKEQPAAKESPEGQLAAGEPHAEQHPAEQPSMEVPVSEEPRVETEAAKAEEEKPGEAATKGSRKRERDEQTADDDGGLEGAEGTTGEQSLPKASGAGEPIGKPPLKRRPRRWLSPEEKTFVCGIDGCRKAYGSASSLCAHKRTHHPGWKGRKGTAGFGKMKGTSQLDLNVATRLDQNSAANRPGGLSDEEAESPSAEYGYSLLNRIIREAPVGYLAQQVPGRLASLAQTAVGGLWPANAQIDDIYREPGLSPAMVWLDLLLQDAQGRLSALQKSRQRIQRAREEEEGAGASGKTAGQHAGPQSGAGKVEKAAASVSILFANMESSLNTEVRRLEGWAKTVQRMMRWLSNKNRALKLAAASQGGTAGDLEKTLEDRDEVLAIASATAQTLATAADVKWPQNPPDGMFPAQLSQRNVFAPPLQDLVAAAQTRRVVDPLAAAKSRLLRAPLGSLTGGDKRPLSEGAPKSEPQREEDVGALQAPVTKQ